MLAYLGTPPTALHFLGDRRKIARGALDWTRVATGMGSPDGNGARLIFPTLRSHRGVSLGLPNKRCKIPGSSVLLLAVMTPARQALLLVAVGRAVERHDRMSH